MPKAAATQPATTGRERFRVTKDSASLHNGIEVGHAVSGSDFVILSIALQPDGEVTLALGQDDAEKLAKALLREREWLLLRDRDDEVLYDSFEVEVIAVA